MEKGFGGKNEFLTAVKKHLWLKDKLSDVQKSRQAYSKPAMVVVKNMLQNSLQ